MTERKIPRLLTPEISDRHWEVIKWRWEFMRRGKVYKDHYKKKKSDWGSTIGIMVDPKISFDDLYREIKKSYRAQKEGFQKEQAIRKEVMLQLGFSIDPSTPLVLTSNPYFISLSVDIFQPDEIIKEQVMSSVKNARRLKDVGLKFDIEKRKKKLYKKYLEVFDLAREGLKREEIAEKVFAEDWEKALDADQDKKKIKDQDSLLTKVSRYKEIAKYLINGRYVEIT